MKEYDTRRREIVESHGQYYEVVDCNHDNKLFDTYTEASIYLEKHGSSDAFIIKRTY